jgi:hypothetical protein
MKYAVKVTRDTRSGEVTVHPVAMVPDGTEGYRLKYSRSHAEGLHVYDTMAEAVEAAAAEQIAADHAAKTDAELIACLRSDLAALKEAGITLHLLCRWMGIQKQLIYHYTNGVLRPNPRSIARVHIIAEALCRTISRIPRLLPASEGCGNARQGRGGRPDLWKESPNAKKARGEQ